MGHFTSDDTQVLHGHSSDPWCSAISTPIVQSTSFRQTKIGGTGHAYSRVSNPTVDALEAALGGLENAPPALAFSTGLAAESTLLFALLKAGDHAVVGGTVYGGTVRLFQRILAPLGVTCTFVDASDVAQVKAALRPETKIVWVESPANPTLALTDIRAVAALTKPRGIKLVVDNTFFTAALLKPLDLGADISVYSTTKHIDGHSAALGGAVVSRDEEVLAAVRFTRKSIGTIQTPFNAYLTLQGLRTLPLRIRQHSENAQRLAEWLASHPAVSRVNYPGLATFPQKALAAAQHGAHHGGVLSFELKGGTPAAIKVLETVKLCTLAEHLGSVETILTHPATMTHADVPAAQRLEVGISDGLIRISVGLEDPADIIADLQQALHAASTKADSQIEPIAPIAGGVLCPTR